MQRDDERRNKYGYARLKVGGEQKDKKNRERTLKPARPKILRGPCEDVHARRVDAECAEVDAQRGLERRIGAQDAGARVVVECIVAAGRVERRVEGRECVHFVHDQVDFVLSDKVSVNTANIKHKMRNLKLGGERMWTTGKEGMGSV